MKTETLFQSLSDLGIRFYSGVPDSQLKEVCQYLETHCTSQGNNWVVPNEGMAVAVAAGHYLATGQPTCVYLQNSGIGNAVNPICSLTSPAVYGIPMVFIIGWRGEPGVKDEPQHVFQGKVTASMMDILDIPYLILDQNSTDEQFQRDISGLSPFLCEGKSIALLVKKGALQGAPAVSYQNAYHLNREETIDCILQNTDERDIVVSSTGKISRELFEIRAKHNAGHHRDFLTVGSMGHCSSIALAIAKQKAGRRVVCIDGDGALLMHMGAMAMIGKEQSQRFIHIVLDNEAHETVGGTPTISGGVDFCGVAKACGYRSAFDTDAAEPLAQHLRQIENAPGPHFIRIRVGLESRADLGRPTRTPLENKQDFMAFLQE